MNVDDETTLYTFTLLVGCLEHASFFHRLGIIIGIPPPRPYKGTYMWFDHVSPLVNHPSIYHKWQTCGFQFTFILGCAFHGVDIWHQRPNGLNKNNRWRFKQQTGGWYRQESSGPAGSVAMRPAMFSSLVLVVLVHKGMLTYIHTHTYIYINCNCRVLAIQSDQEYLGSFRWIDLKSLAKIAKNQRFSASWSAIKSPLNHIKPCLSRCFHVFFVELPWVGPLKKHQGRAAPRPPPERPGERGLPRLGERILDLRRGWSLENSADWTMEHRHWS